MKWVWLLSALTIAGVGLLSAGAALLINRTGLDGLILSSLGGAIIGAVISAALATIDSRTILNSIRSSIQADFRSTESLLPDFRGKWHIYHATSKDRKPIWSYAIADFSNTSFPGSLFSKIYLLNLNGKKKKYEITAGIRDVRFVLLLKGRGEPCTVAVYPSVGKDYGDEHCGIWVHETWDGKPSISATIISAKPLRGVTKVGDITDEEKLTILNNFWAKNFKMNILSSVMPLINASSSPDIFDSSREEIKSHNPRTPDRSQ